MSLKTDSSPARDLINDAEAAGPCPEASCCGRGIVICAGGPVMLTNAYVLVRVLRDIHKSTLPIEIWHLGAREMPGLLATVFISLGCRIIDALGRNHDPEISIHDGWQLKSYAIKNSGFEDVLLLDADQVPLSDPANLFDCPQYLETGAIFWPDIIDLSAENPIWPMLGLEPERVRSWESGQMCINRKKHWRAVCIASSMNERAEVFYQLVYGDKDTFLFAWRLSSSEFSLVPHLPFQNERFLCQRDFSGAPLFQHRTNCKWALDEVNVNPSGFKLFDECENFLNELREIWNGRIFHPPLRNVTARKMEKQLLEIGLFSCFRGAENSGQIELLPGHQIGKGRSHSFMNWSVDYSEGQHQLILYGNEKRTAVLDIDEERHCSGSTVTRPAKDIHLAPFDDTYVHPSPSNSAEGLIGDLTRAACSDGKYEAANMDRLASSIHLLHRADPEIFAEVQIVADLYAATDPKLSEHLQRIASELTAPAQDTKPIKRSSTDQLGNKQLYVRR